MALFTTGLVDNPPVAGVRPSATVDVLLTNDALLPIDVQISGYFLAGGSKTQYVAELFALAPGDVAARNYSTAQFDAFEFEFSITAIGLEISVWGKDAAGNLVAAHRLVPAEINLVA